VRRRGGDGAARQISAKRVLDAQRCEFLPVLHVFAQDRVATALQGSRDDRGVVDVELMRGRKGESALWLTGIRTPRSRTMSFQVVTSAPQGAGSGIGAAIRSAPPRRLQASRPDGWTCSIEGVIIRFEVDLEASRGGAG
jgi:hypothetical protein